MGRPKYGRPHIRKWPYFASKVAHSVPSQQSVHPGPTVMCPAWQQSLLWYLQLLTLQEMPSIFSQSLQLSNISVTPFICFRRFSSRLYYYSQNFKKYYILF